LLEIDEKTGKMRLSMRALIEKPEGYVEPERRPRPQGRDDRRGNDRRDDRRGNDRRAPRDDRRGDRRDDRKGPRDDRRGGRKPFGQKPVEENSDYSAPELNAQDDSQDVLF
ncbi:MAG: polyribonucleotide nucleotidyltransferase, partial [Candidatus Cryptobacteroides sp.]